MTKEGLHYAGTPGSALTLVTLVTLGCYDGTPGYGGIDWQTAIVGYPSLPQNQN
jgi:hypothetical protein